MRWRQRYWIFHIRWAHNRGNAFARKSQLRAITEGLESKDLQLFKFKQLSYSFRMANHCTAGAEQILSFRFVTACS